MEDAIVDAIDYNVQHTNKRIDEKIKEDRPRHLKHATKKYVIEYLRCKNSFEYFTTNHILLELPGGDELMEPYEKQLEFIDMVERKRHVLLLKSRQTGFSTIVQAYTAWLCTFHDNVVVGIISKTKSKQVAGLIYNSLLALQHRGQESAGIATFNGIEIKIHKKPGLVANVFSNNSFLFKKSINSWILISM